MKKAIVLSTDASHAIIMKTGGEVKKIRNRNYMIGQEITEEPRTMKMFSKLLAVASAVLVIAGGAFVYAYNLPTTYVSFDVNPSVEFTVNMFDRVLEVKGVNDDGTTLLETNVELQNLGNRSIVDAMNTVITSLNLPEGSPVVITVACDDQDKADELVAKLEKSTAEETKVAPEGLAIGWYRVQQARELGVTPGKLNLVEKYMDTYKATIDNMTEEDKALLIAEGKLVLDAEGKLVLTDDAKLNMIKEWLTKPVKDIMAEIKANGGNPKFTKEEQERFREEAKNKPQKNTPKGKNK